MLAAWGLLSLALFGLASSGSGRCKGAHLHLELAGSEASLAGLLTGVCAGLDAAALRTGVMLDLVFVAVFFLALPFVLPALGRRGWSSRRLQRLGGRLGMLGLFAGGLDVLEDLVLLHGLPSSGTPALDDPHALAAAVLAWPKFAIVVAVLGYALFSIVGAIGLRGVSEPDGSASPSPDPVELGVCFSGGGVRSATYASGVMQAWHAERLWHQTDLLTAVSGGAYLASAVSISRHHAPDADTPVFAYGSEESEWLEDHQRYLTSGPGGWLGALWSFAWRLVVHLAVLGTALWLVSVPVGWLAASPWVRECLPDCRGLELQASLWVPGAWTAGLATLLFLVSFVAKRDRLRRSARALGIVAAACLLLLVLLPVAIQVVTDAGASIGGIRWGRVFQAAAGSGLVVTVGRLLVKQASPFLTRVGGVLVVVVGVLVGGEFATNAAAANPGAWFAAGGDLWPDPVGGVWLVVAVLFCIAYWRADPSSWSLHTFYRHRLRSAYATRRTASGVEALPETDEPTFESIGKDGGPEIVVCAAANISDGADTHPRLPAVSITFGRDGVSLVYSKRAAEDVRFLGRPRARIVAPPDRFAAVATRYGRRHVATYSAAAAVSGAAFASAMGRHSLGTTNAFLAAVNLDLGAWIPNPLYLADASVLKPLRWSAVVKELFGVYDIEDPYLFVTDGGHWENLGLVELVRRGCRDIVCFDAAGTKSDSFATMAEAVELAFLECGAVVDVDWEPMRAALDASGRAPPVAPADVAVGTVAYADGRVGTLFYAKTAVTRQAPPLVRMYAETEPGFPFHGTGDQWFDERQFTGYRDLGRHTAMVVARLYRKWLDALERGDPADLPEALVPLQKAFHGIRRWPEPARHVEPCPHCGRDVLTAWSDCVWCGLGKAGSPGPEDAKSDR